jgi:hypothetical protein
MYVLLDFQLMTLLQIRSSNHSMIDLRRCYTFEVMSLSSSNSLSDDQVQVQILLYRTEYLNSLY